MSEEDSCTGSVVELEQSSKSEVSIASTASQNNQVTRSRRSQFKGSEGRRLQGRQKSQQDRLLATATGEKHTTAKGSKPGSVHPRGSKRGRVKDHHKWSNRGHYEKGDDWIGSKTDQDVTLGACYGGDPSLLTAQLAQWEFKPITGYKNDKETFQEAVTSLKVDAMYCPPGLMHEDVGQCSRSTATERLHEDFKGGTPRNIKETGCAQGNSRQRPRRGRHSAYGIKDKYQCNEAEAWMYTYPHEKSDPSTGREVNNKYLVKSNFQSGVKVPYSSKHVDDSEHTKSDDKLDIRKNRSKGSNGEATMGKDKRKGNKHNIDYRRQKTDVLRALSHLNPTTSAQASVLIDQLRNETYECMVCCEKVRCSAAVWSCQSCYHVFHLGCIRRWAKCSATAGKEGETGGWRCPGCQNIAHEIPVVYKCFCGKVTDPEWKRREGLTPHSCGELCGKKRELQCPHQCNQLCHPGPCPSCPVMITKQCSCGKTNNPIRCGEQATAISCKEVCNNMLNCYTHRCTRICHPGPCGDCQVNVLQTCYCGKQKRVALCGTGDPGCNITDRKSGYFSCKGECLRVLDCGNHHCEEMCHQGACCECPVKPSLVFSCPCGKTSLSDILGNDHVRTSCLDPVPTCKSTCDKILPCSPEITAEGNQIGCSEEHRCKSKCHLGDCGPCDGIAKVRCRCGKNVKEIPCVESKLEEFTCDQRCNRKKHCGRHRCNQKCCVDTQHRCELVCGKQLRCGHHKCLEPCHPGYCPPCLMSGFDELACNCGATVLYPPIPCGTQPPECDKPCSRTHACSHPVIHNCHSEDVCPPCTVLTEKKCMGDHEVRRNIPCHVKDISCGNVCRKLLKCEHKCQKVCHKPPCLGPDENCVQPCELKRKACGHPCSAPCHPNMECPKLPCQAKVSVNCKCGRRSESLPCLQGGEKVVVAQAYQRIATETLANKMKDLQSGQSVDISSILNVDDKKTRHIDCNDACALYERNRRLAEALNIENADRSPCQTVRFSPFLVAEAKQNLTFLKSVEVALEDLVRATVKMSCSQRSYSFPPMNSNQRRVIHEIAVYYNCSSRSYDQEPKRNTVVTATKDSHLPPVKLSFQIERELNLHPPRPIPLLPSTVKKPSRSSSEDAKRRGESLTHVRDYFSDEITD